MVAEEHRTICDVVRSEGRELMPTGDMRTRFIEIPKKAEIECSQCKHHLSYGYGHYCVRTPHWSGHKEYGRPR